MGKVGALAGIIALGAAGGFIGGAFLPGVFSQIGMSVGISVGSMLFASPQRKGASSTDDLKAQIAEATFLKILCGGAVPDPGNPGQTLPGGVWTAGSVIDCAPDGGIVKVAKPADGGGGGTLGRLFGMGGEKEYAHYISLVVAWCEGSSEHPVELEELKADDKLVYRRGAGNDQAGYIPMTVANDQNGNPYGRVSQNLRHYYGTGTQLPDDIVQTWHPGGAAPAYRNTCCSVILNFPIDEFGHIPTFYARLSNGVTARIDQVRFFLKRANGLDGETMLPMDRVHLSKISGHSRGWWMSQPGSTGEIAQFVAARSLCKLVEHSGGIWDVDLTNPAIFDVPEEDCGARDEEGSGDGDSLGATFGPVAGLEEPASIPNKTNVRFSDGSKNGDDSKVTSQIETATHENVQSYDFPTVDSPNEMQVWSDIMLDGAWVGRSPVEVALPPGHIRKAPGDVLRIPKASGGVWQMMIEEQTLGAPGAIICKGRTWQAETYGNRPFIPPTAPVIDATTWAAPILFVSNPVALTETSPDMVNGGPGIIFGATQTAEHFWNGALSWELDRNVANWDDFLKGSLQFRAQIGELTASYTPGQPWADYDYSSQLSARMFFGTLATAQELIVDKGANRLLFENGLLVSFVTAIQTGPDTFSLSGLQPGRFGSDDFAQTLAPGARFVLLQNEFGERDGALIWKPLEAFRMSQGGGLMQLQAWPDKKRDKIAVRQFAFTGANVAPPSPVGVRATRRVDGSLRLVGRGRSRIPEDGGWDSAIPGRMSETRFADGFRFLVSLSSGGQSVQVPRAALDDYGAFDFSWSAGELAGLFGGAPGALSGDVALRGNYGWGRARAWQEEQI